jgi:hypothetical protein
VDPRVIGRFVDVTASPTAVVVFCQGQVVAEHRRSWAKQAVVTDPAHVTRARQLRRNLAQDRHSSRIVTPGTVPGTASGARQHPDGHVVELRALPDYDALFGVDFTPTATPTAMGPGTPIGPSAITLSTTEASP